IDVSHGTAENAVDVVFPVLHGTYGEDGTIQGLLKLANIPFVGASVLGSAVGMDKDVMKRLLRDAGLPVARFIVVKRSDVIARSEAPYHLVQGEATKQSQRDRHGRLGRPRDDKGISFNEIVKQLGLPFFVKPANAGSSVGVSKVHNEKEFASAVNTAFSYDSKMLVEEFIKGREIECSVLGNENATASLPGEIIPTHEFYDYDAKYIDEKGAALQIPATLQQKKVKEVQALAVKAFQTLCCEGMARVDFFLNKNGKFFVNEINTIPGFTKISMYPKLWEASGVPYSELIDRLIQLAIERHKREQKLKTSYA
ncbi:MAG: D-alanine--D-alanine ligase, partial [Candidatus Levybacteria bacterium]|nr:D-alanine--D-alanine ligase [Candidatus Levybacteria bacterium]